MSTPRTSTHLALAGGALALALALSACGGAPQATSPAEEGTPTATAQAGVSAEHNGADIRFARMMIPHHRQAVEMAELAADRAENPGVTALAEKIRAAQDPEIETMTGFLDAWGAEVPAESGVVSMDHPGMDGMPEMSGMMTPEQLNRLRDATGTAFDTMFLQMMIAHHEGAVTDAQREIAEGVNPQAKDLAGAIISAQTAEIGQMRQLLQTG